MKKTIKKKWLKALRSGEYQQGTGRLKRKESETCESYCCLGVLTDLYLKEKGGQWVCVDTGEKYGVFRPVDADEVSFSVATLSGPVMKWSGITSEWGTYDDITGPGGTQSLTTLNDGKRLTFTEIADVIEAKF